MALLAGYTCAQPHHRQAPPLLSPTIAPAPSATIAEPLDGGSRAAPQLRGGARRAERTHARRHASPLAPSTIFHNFHARRYAKPLAGVVCFSGWPALAAELTKRVAAGANAKTPAFVAHGTRDQARAPRLPRIASDCF